MLCYSYRLLSLLFAVSVSAKASHTPKPPTHHNRSSLTDSPFPTNPVSSYGTISFVSATNGSTGLSKTIKHPHSKSITGTAVLSTGTSPGTTKSGKPSHTPISSVHTKNSTTTSPSTTLTTLPSTTSSTPPTGTPTSFKIQIAFAFVYPTPPPIAGDYVFLTPGGTGNNDADIMQLTPDASQATIFTLNADGTLSSGDLIADLPALAAYYPLLFQTEATITAGGFYKTTCAIAAGELDCATNTGSYFTDDVVLTCDTGPYSLEFGPTGRPYNTGCYSLVLLVAPV